MRRLFKQSFTFEKVRYLVTLDTDCLQLLLNCYFGSSEKNEKVELKEQGLRNKVFSVIKEEQGSDLAYNAMKNPKKIDNYVRHNKNIPYPDMPEWDEMISDIIISGQIEFFGHLADFLEYLEYKNVKVVHFLYREKQIIIDANCENNRVRDFLDNLEVEIQSLKKLQTDIFNQMDRVQSESGIKDYWRWRMK